MTRPGDWLRRIALRMCSAEQVERVVDPLVADLQWEHANALARGAAWRARLVHLRAVAAFWRILGPAWIASGEDDGAVRRVVLSVMAWTLAATATLVWAALRSVFHVPGRIAPHKMLILAFLAPQALPIGIAIGLAVGITMALRSARQTAHTRRVVLTAAAVIALGMLLNLGWALPAANQAFRTAAFGAAPMRGAVELTLPELRAVAIRQLRGESVRDVFPTPGRRLLAFEYWIRWALIASPVVLTFFALAVAPLLHSRTIAIAVGWLAIFACRGLWISTGFAATGWWSAALAAWTPNLLVLLGAVALTALGRRVRTPAV